MIALMLVLSGLEMLGCEFKSCLLLMVLLLLHHKHLNCLELDFNWNWLLLLLLGTKVVIVCNFEIIVIDLRLIRKRSKVAKFLLPCRLLCGCRRFISSKWHEMTIN